MRPQRIEKGDGLAWNRAIVLMPFENGPDEISAWAVDHGRGHVADAVRTKEVGVDLIRCNLLVGEEIAVIDEAGMIESQCARKPGIARRPAVVHELVDALGAAAGVNVIHTHRKM